MLKCRSRSARSAGCSASGTSSAKRFVVAGAEFVHDAAVRAGARERLVDGGEEPVGDAPERARHDDAAEGVVFGLHELHHALDAGGIAHGRAAKLVDLNLAGHGERWDGPEPRSYLGAARRGAQIRENRRERFFRGAQA